MKFLRSIIAGIALAVLTSGSALAQCGTTAPANKFCGNDTGASALATWKSVPTGALSPVPGGTVLGNRTGASAVPTAVTNPVLGIPGTSTGEVGLAGATSGTAILRAQAAAGSAVNLMPTSAGTLVSTSSSPLVINSTSGLMTCPTCVTSSGGGAITGTAPIAVSGAGVVSINAPYVTLTASNGGIVYSGATNLAILSGTATAGQILRSGSSAAPSWSTATYPATTAAGSVLASSSANTVTSTTTPVLGVAGTAIGSIGFQNATSGTVTLQPVAGALGVVTINIPAAAGTMAVSATAPITLSAAGAVGITGAALTKTDDTNVTLTLGGTPASALLAATSLTLGWTGQLSVGRGGTGGSVASGTLLDNITGFASTGFMSRTGAGTYTFTGSSGSGSVALTTSPVFTTPTLGAAIGTSLALGGATIGANALAVNGTSLFSSAVTISTSSAAALSVGNTGATNPAFLVDASTASSVTGLSIKSAAAGGRIALAAISSAATEIMEIDGKGTGGIVIGSHSTGSVNLGASGGGVVITSPLSGSAFGTNVTGALSTTLSAAGGLTSTIASGTSALGTGAISSGVCATVVTTAATNTLTTDVLLAGFNGDPTAVTGYAPTVNGMLTVIAYPTANNVNFKVCNNTGASITPGAITLNWRVVR